MSQLILERIRFLPHHIDLVYHLSYNGYKWRRATRRVHSFTKSVIQKRKNALKDPAYDRVKERKYIDFLDILLSAKVIGSLLHFHNESQKPELKNS